jgi:hypothetical protein
MYRDKENPMRKFLAVLLSIFVLASASTTAPAQDRPARADVSTPTSVKHALCTISILLCVFDLDSKTLNPTDSEQTSQRDSHSNREQE